VDAITNNFGNVLLWTFWVFILIGALFLWGLAFVDVFADRDLSGWAKAGWVALLVLVPWVGVAIYLIVRDHSKRRLAKTLNMPV
jgi:Phospholipase_D-nuclease N-terminal